MQQLQTPKNNQGWPKPPFDRLASGLVIAGPFAVVGPQIIENWNVIDDPSFKLI